MVTKTTGLSHHHSSTPTMYPKIYHSWRNNLQSQESHINPSTESDDDESYQDITEQNDAFLWTPPTKEKEDSQHGFFWIIPN